MKKHILILMPAFLLGIASCTGPSEEPIKEHKVTKTAIKAYESDAYALDIDAYFVDDIDSPYFDLKDLVSQRMAGPQKEGFPVPELKLECKNGLLSSTNHIFGGDYTLYFNAKDNTVYSDNYIKALSVFDWGNPLDSLSADFSPIATPVAPVHGDHNKRATLDFKPYGIDLVAYNDTVLVPLFILNNTYFQDGEKIYRYNGEDIYLLEAVDKSANPECFKRFYHIKDMNEGGIVYEDGFKLNQPYNEATARFNGNAILSTYDMFYGLRGESSFINAEVQAKYVGVYDDLFSTSPEKASRALAILTESIGDMHTNYSNTPASLGPAYDEPFAYEATFSPAERYYGYRLESYYRAYITNYYARLEGIGEEAATGIYFHDDTCIIRFNAFNRLPNDIVFGDHGLNQVEYTKNSFTLFYDAFASLKQRDDIKNIVIDGSLNQGGDVTTLMEIAGFFMDTVKFTIQNNVTGEYIDYAYEIDTNLDGKHDEDDYPGVDYNVYYLTSEISFSCGNFLPSVIKSNKAGTLLGRTSGGGACIVMPNSSPVGDEYRLSSSMKIVNEVDKGQYMNIDKGIHPDYYLENEIMYNNDNLIQLIHGLSNQ